MSISEKFVECNVLKLDKRWLLKISIDALTFEVTRCCSTFKARIGRLMLGRNNTLQGLTETPVFMQIDTPERKISPSSELSSGSEQNLSSWTSTGTCILVSPKRCVGLIYLSILLVSEQ